MSTVSKSFFIHISHPFCLPTGNAPISRYQRKAKITALAKAINLSASVKWNTYDFDGKLPAIMKKRKDLILRTEEVLDEACFAKVKELDKAYGDVRAVKSVKRSAYYWDWGLGATDIMIEFELKNVSGLHNIYQTAEDFEEWMFEQDGYLPPGIESWAHLQKTFLDAFHYCGIRTISWLTAPEAPEFRLETCCWNLLLTASTNGISASRESLQTCLEQFCGEKVSETSFDTGVGSILATHVGWSGNATLSVDEETTERVAWLYRAVALLYGSLLESVEPIYDVLTELANDTENGMRKAGNIRNVRMIIDLLHNEANPTTVCSESFDGCIYARVWDAWGGEEIDSLLDKRGEFLNSVLADISSTRSAGLQNRLNLVVFVLTIVSVASTVAAIIDLLDSTQNLDSLVRAILLGVVTGFLGIACLIVILADKRLINAFVFYTNQMFSCLTSRASVAPAKPASAPQDEDIVVQGKE